jgi:hypothetical protein
VKEYLHWETISARRARNVARALREIGYHATIAMVRGKSPGKLAVYYEKFDHHRALFLCRVIMEAAGLIPKSNR